jgi:hypothetical protein
MYTTHSVQSDWGDDLDDLFKFEVLQSQLILQKVTVIGNQLQLRTVITHANPSSTSNIGVQDVTPTTLHPDTEMSVHFNRWAQVSSKTIGKQRQPAMG